MKIIISHTYCDFDAFASMVAANLLFPDAQICLVGDADESVKKFLKDFHYKFNFLKERQIELNVIESVILVDNYRLDRLNKIGKFLLDNPHIPVICFDHHPIDKKPDNFLFYHYDKTGSCVSLLLRFIHEKNIKVEPFIATVLAMGIYEDTGNFVNENTSSADFSAMAYLLSLGASLKTIKKYINHSFNASELKLMNKMLNSVETHLINGIKVTFLYLNLPVHRQNISSLVQHIRQSENISCLFCFVTCKNKLSIIARSDYPFIPVDEILISFGGGGHPSSASATLTDVDVIYIEKNILKLISLWIEKSGTVKDIMSKNLLTVRPETSLESAMHLLLSHNVGALIVEEGKTLKGLITKKDITKLVMHQLSNYTVDKFMTPDPITISSEMSVHAASQIMLEHDIGRLPVEKSASNKEIIGIISRRDLLNAKQFSESRHKRLETAFGNVATVLNDFITDTLKLIFDQVAYLADSMNIKAYTVGGFVRDLLMGKKNIDIDIVVEGDAIQFAEAFKKSYGHKFVAFPKFQTALIEYPGIKKIDVASARSEIYQKPGFLPDVTTSSIRNDLYRRDFTINSIAIQLNQNQRGLLIDYFHGRRDIQKGIIRVLHNLSFIDDPTRILRAVRFEQRFGFKMDTKTQHLLRNSIEMDILKTVAVERLQQELIHSCDETVPQKFFHRLYELGILKKLNQNLTFDFNKSTYFDEIYTLIIWFTQSFPAEHIKPWVIYHLALTHDMSLRTKQKFAEQYKYPNIFFECLMQSHNFLENDLHKTESSIRPGILADIFSSYNTETLLFISIIKKTGHISEKIKSYLAKWRFIKPEINGNDLISMGLKPGVHFGKILKDLKIYKIDGNFPEKNDEFEYIKNTYLN